MRRLHPVAIEFDFVAPPVGGLGFNVASRLRLIQSVAVETELVGRL